MPSFDSVQKTIEVDVDIDVEFEVVCGTCGTGLCGNTDTRVSYNRNMPQAVINACEVCMENAAEERETEVSAKYEEDVDKLRDVIQFLETQIEELNDAKNRSHDDPNA